MGVGGHTAVAVRRVCAQAVADSRSSRAPSHPAQVAMASCGSRGRRQGHVHRDCRMRLRNT
eukprot:1662301-Alexandrium_andersonii.AAC.1